MNLTVQPEYVSRMTFGRRMIEAKIACVFPHWKLVGIHQVSKQGVPPWLTPDDLHKNPDRLLDLVKLGYDKVCLSLAHENGIGEAYPDYWAWELGEEFVWKIGDRTEVFVNQGWREATILAVLGDEALLEYQMPAGTTALWIISVHDKDAGCRRNLSYRTCPKKWLAALEETGVPWTGRPQTGRIF